MLPPQVLSKGLPHPFALTLFEDTVYWTDWRTRSVLGANKETGKRMHVVLDNLHFPMQIHSCHPKRQRPYQDRCPRAADACSHLCLPSATSFTCVCPVGVRLLPNRSDNLQKKKYSPATQTFQSKKENANVLFARFMMVLLSLIQ